MKEEEKNFEELKLIAEHYKQLLKVGACSYEEARANVDPYVNAVNEKAKELAKKYNRRAPKLSPMAFLR